MGSDCEISRKSKHAGNLPQQRSSHFVPHSSCCITRTAGSSTGPLAGRSLPMFLEHREFVSALYHDLRNRAKQSSRSGPQQLCRMSQMQELVLGHSRCKLLVKRAAAQRALRPRCGIGQRRGDACGIVAAGLPHLSEFIRDGPHSRSPLLGRSDGDDGGVQKCKIRTYGNSGSILEFLLDSLGPACAFRLISRRTSVPETHRYMARLHL